MVDTWTFDRVLHWLLFLALGLFVLMLNVLPLGSGAPGWPAPEFLLVLAAGWVIRHPEFLPLPLFAVLAILADFLLMRPPGLYALLSVLMIEFLRSRAHASREWPFLLEWAIFAVLLFGILLTNRLYHFVFVIQQARFGLEMQQFLSSVLAYPLVVGLSVWLFGLARPKPGDAGGRQ